MTPIQTDVRIMAIFAFSRNANRGSSGETDAETGLRGLGNSANLENKGLQTGLDLVRPWSIGGNLRKLGGNGLRLSHSGQRLSKYAER